MGPSGHSGATARSSRARSLVSVSRSPENSALSGPRGRGLGGGQVTPIFPLSALVGVDDMVLALLLAAMDPRIGGVLLRGEKGSAKTTAARGLAALLGPDAPFVELPLGATEDRVVGALDLRAVLGRGEHAFQPGLLAAAHGGVLYVDEVNLLADHLVDVLLDVATSGVNRVERDGISHVHQSNFVLVGSMNPEEGELRPQLLDRFGLSVQVTAPIDPTVRAEAVRRRRSFDSDPVGFQAQWANAEAEMRQRLAVAIPAPLAEGIEERIAYLCVQAGAEGLRSDLVICRAAAALAGWTGADVAGEMEVSAVAQFALAHRMRTPWDTTKPDHPSLEQLVEHTKGPSNAPDGDDIPGSPRGSVPDPNAGPAQNPDPETRDTEVGDSTNRQDPAPTGDGGSPPPTLLDPVRSHGDASARAVGRRRGGASVAPRGRVIGAAQVPGSGTVSSVSAKATVTAAVTRTVESGSVVPLPLKIEGADLREAVHAQRLSNLIVLVVDASGSMGAAARVATARGAVMALLKDAYQRRDSVAMVVFRAEGAETVLRPTSSTEIGRA